MSEAGPRDRKRTVTRRTFVQSTALLTGIAAGGGQFVEPRPVRAEESAADARVAQAAPVVQGARAPTTPVQTPSDLPATPDISLQEFIKLSQVLTGLF